MGSRGVDIAMVTNFGTQFAVTGFVWTIATRWLVMEGVRVVGQQNADVADVLQLRDVATATIFWLSVWYNFGCVIISDMLFDSWGEFSSEAIPWRHSRDQDSNGHCHGNYFLAFYIWGAHWCHLAITTGPFVCGSNAALCQITLTTCYGRPMK